MMMNFSAESSTEHETKIGASLKNLFIFNKKKSREMLEIPVALKMYATEAKHRLQEGKKQ